MSASLDKSLDDIISSSRKSFKSRRPGAKVGAKGGNQNRVGKKVGGGSNNKKNIVKFNKKSNAPAAPAAAAAAASSPAFDLSYATKVNVSNLPKDLKHDNIKVCLFGIEVNSRFVDEMGI